MGGKNVTPTEDIVETPQDKQALRYCQKEKKVGLILAWSILQREQFWNL